MARRLLFLNNGPREVLAGRPDERLRELGLEVDRYWAYRGEFPDTLAGYAGAYLSGSPHSAYDDEGWIRTEHELIRELAREGLPTLGVCFGSQILASALCGRDQVFRRPSCEVGYAWLELEEPASEDRLFDGLADRLLMFVWHNDDVRDGHPDMTVLAATAAAPNHIWRFRELPIWGIQGHPEVDRRQAQVWFEQIRTVLDRDGADVDRLKAEADDTADAKRLLANFAGVVTGG